MSDPLRMLRPTTSGDTGNAISLRASAAGPAPCDSQDGPTTERSGPEVVHALRSQSQAEKRSARHAKARTLCRMLDEVATSYAVDASMNGLPTPGTYGRKCGDLSARDALDTFLENRLREATEKLGSPLFELRWKYLDMTLGPQVLTLRASARSISAKDYFGWHTPLASDRGSGKAMRMLSDQARMAGWGTVTTEDKGAGDGTKQRGKSRLGDQARMAMMRPWGTPTRRDNLGRFGENQLSGTMPSPTSAPATGSGGQLNPETVALVDGLPGRVGMQCGYGNAIVPPQGAAFIRAFMQAEAFCFPALGSSNSAGVHKFTEIASSR
jgi:hypothetical protein